MAEMTDQELDDALLDKRLQKARDRRAMQAEPEVPQTSINWDTMSKNVKSLVGGTSIGGHLPVIGEPLRKAGTALGSAVGAGIGALTSDNSFSDLYDKNQARSEAAHQKDLAVDKQGPIGTFTKDLGAQITMPVPKAAMTESLIPEATRYLGRAGKFLMGTGERAGYQGAISGADTASRGGTQDEVINSAKYGAALSGAADVAPQIAKGLGIAYTRGVAQIPAKDFEHYKANRQAVQSIEPQKVYEEFSAAGNEMKKRGQLMSEEAGRGQNEAVRQAESEALLKRNQYDAAAAREKSEGLGHAKEIREDVGKSEANDLAESEGVKRNLADGIVDLPKKARAEISASAQEMTELAMASGKRIKVAPFTALAKRKLNDILITLSDKGGKQTEVIQKWISRLESLGDKTLDAAQFRRMTQALDEEIEHIYAASAKGQRIGPDGRALMDIRKGYSEKLKKILPGYRKGMKQTSDMMESFKPFDEHFNTDSDAVYRQMGDIHSPGREGRLEALQNADQKFKGGLQPDLDRLKAIKERDYAPRLDEAKNIESLDYEGNYELPKSFVEAEKTRKIGEAEEKFRPEYARAKDVEGLSRYINRDENARSFMEKYGRRPEQFADRKKQMEAIALEEGKPVNHYTDQARNAYVKRAMTGGQIQGSRLTKLGSTAGEAAAEAVGIKGSKIMGFLGASAGAVSDIVGKDVVRKISDLVASPGGQRFAKIFSEAYKRGPQAVAMTHAMLMKKDPDYKNLMQQKEEVAP